MIHTDIDTTGYSKKRRWCVPSAVALLTGVPLVRATERLSAITGRSYEELSGVELSAAQLLLRELGYETRVVDLTERYRAPPQVQRFMAERQGLEQVMPLLLSNADHAFVAHYGMLFDNACPSGAPVAASHLRYKRLTEAYLVAPVARRVAA